MTVWQSAADSAEKVGGAARGGKRCRRPAGLLPTPLGFGGQVYIKYVFVRVCAHVRMREVVCRSADERQ